jgi:hypothetical protein
VCSTQIRAEDWRRFASPAVVLGDRHVLQVLGALGRGRDLAGELVGQASVAIVDLGLRIRVPVELLGDTLAAHRPLLVLMVFCLGELTQVIPIELVDGMVEETRTRERRLRDLPSRVGVYFVLALGLFEGLGAQLVWEGLTAGLGVAVPRPSEKALRDVRRSLGVPPIQPLFEVLAGPLVRPSTPRSALPVLADRGLRRMRLCVTDQDRNRSWLGTSSSLRHRGLSPRLTQALTLRARRPAHPAMCAAGETGR